jgi:hypothetical protein
MKRGVMRGLDPRIHLEKVLVKMDCRVKPGNDAVGAENKGKSWKS